MWFPGMLVNYAEHVFRDRDDCALAIVAGGERRDDAELSWGGLRGLLAAQRASDVIQVPRTLSGKVLELPVKRILMGTPPDRAAARVSLANPEALDASVSLASERGT